MAPGARPEGDASVGSSDRFASAFGVAAGYGYRPAPDMKIGVSFASGARTTTLPMVSAAAAATSCRWPYMARRTSARPIWLARSPTPTTGFDEPLCAHSPPPTPSTADFNAHDFAAPVETGIHYGWLTPYAPRAPRPSTRRPTRRRAHPQGAAFALAYDDSTTYSARTELGVRLARSIAIHNGKTLDLHGRVAWAHDFSSAPSVVAEFPVAARLAFHRHRVPRRQRLRPRLRRRRYHIHQRVRDRRLVRWRVFGRVAELWRQGTCALQRGEPISEQTTPATARRFAGVVR